MSFAPWVWEDSKAYFAVGRDGWLSLQLWAGSRAPLVPALMKLTGTYYRYEVLQGIVGGLAWAFLAYTVSRLVSASWRKPVVTLIVLGFAASPLVVMWDGSALSESPSLSMLAVVWASGIWLLRRFTWVRLALLGASTLAYCTLRDADIPTVGTIGVVLVGVGFLVLVEGVVNDGRARLGRNWPRARPATAVGALLILVAGLTGGAAYSSHRGVVNVEQAFDVRIFPYPARVAWFASDGMPEASEIDHLAPRVLPSPGSAPVVDLDLDSPQWAPLRTWFSRHGTTAYVTFLVLHPGYVLTAPFASPPLTYNNPTGEIAFYQPTGYPLAPVLGDMFAPNRVVVAIMALAALVVAAVRRVWRLRAWRFTALFAVLGLWSMLLAWHGDGEQVTRHIVEGDVEVRVGVLLALLVAVFATRPAVAAPSASLPAAPLHLPSPWGTGPAEPEQQRTSDDYGPIGGPAPVSGDPAPVGGSADPFRPGWPWDP